VGPDRRQIRLQAFVSQGSTSSSDDHEFWNNAFPSFSVNTFTAGGPEGLVGARQRVTCGLSGPTRERTLRRFTIGDLALLVADTRIRRSGDRTTFLDPADMDQLVAWIAA
jgi:hypothetical protein